MVIIFLSCLLYYFILWYIIPFICLGFIWTGGSLKTKSGDSIYLLPVLLNDVRSSYVCLGVYVNLCMFVCAFLYFLIENCLSPLCVVVFSPLLWRCLSRPLQDGDIINIDVTVSNPCFWVVAVFLIAFDQLSEFLVATGRIVDCKCSVHGVNVPFYIQAKQLVSSFVSPPHTHPLCLFQLDPGLTCI